ncbi:MAG: DNA/RNA non-specific endonuclease [Gemmatimonadota bacterium]|nr:DNA/RNA non-specific endonuclease [Gemmatimonadota bacterium]
MDVPSVRREARYGIPQADQVIYNRHYITGYSYYFRQAKWALEIIDPDYTGLERVDNFRPDYRVPEMFRADLADYKGYGYDRGHLVASANQREVKLQNSETFLLSNMSPQVPGFNRGLWKELEDATRALNEQEHILETYVICGPIFHFDEATELIGSEDDNGVTLPIPNAYFKSILTENDRGTLDFWSFILPNERIDRPLKSFLVPTTKIEQYAGVHLWNRLQGATIARKKRAQRRRMWSY